MAVVARGTHPSGSTATITTNTVAGNECFNLRIEHGRRELADWSQSLVGAKRIAAGYTGAGWKWTKEC